ncbi:hypothetical protein LTR37_010646 [Vermiconidia calcicola]|uniref:Uncharacterized protein n=1 Tax=Vermiconidia calcicola TaxID=1690605 RepID=A0ACC3N4A7_9PEZI|nr:hypothetical protein LTR37_010646 [Vermiconidia calcicola]
MNSPPAQLIEQSMIDFDGPPSSPFVTEVESNRSPSRQWKSSMAEFVVEEDAPLVAPQHEDIMNVQDLYEDKENVPQPESTLAMFFASPDKKQSKQETSPVKDQLRRSSNASELMPPPSTRKAATSPRKTPLKSSKEEVRTPKSLSRGNSSERTPSENATAFQAGLDMRGAMMPHEEQRDIDDTCFSAFSEIPDMTAFAKLGQSPTRRGESLRTPRGDTATTPRTSRKRSSPSRSPSPTPRRQKTPSQSSHDGTSNFLIDFTQQIEGVPSFRQGSPTKSATESNLLQYINNQRSPAKSSSRHMVSTPNKPNSILNLLDFELPPVPTPRSVPTITVRELESLKSSYLSQISSLKATLSGREAEVDSLKKAVGDAERRVGEAQETLRDERNKREYAEQEIDGWKKRGQEFEVVLKSVKEEVMKSDAEKEDTNKRLEETERRVEDAEARAIKAEERFADALAARAGSTEGGDGSDIEEQVQRLVSAQIDAKIEAVSRELHMVYKEKHERKVATLKKSYEARNEKKTAELHSRVSELEKVNEELQAAKDATFSGPVNDSMLHNADHVELKAQIEEQKAHLARLESEMQASRHQQQQLEHELEQERIEKGDLVAAVDEMLALQSEAPPTPAGARAMSAVEDFRKSISRPTSGLRAPGAGIGGGESKIGRSIPAPALNRSGGSGAGKSRMLANIERMGRTGSNSGQSASGYE